MQIEVNRIANGEKIKIEVTESVKVPPSYLLVNENVSVFFEGTLVRHTDVFTLKGKLKATIIIPCSRCLKDTEFALNIVFLEKFSLNNENEDYFPINNDILDSSEAFLMNLILNIPVKALCNDDCLGIC